MLLPRRRQSILARVVGLAEKKSENAEAGERKSGYWKEKTEKALQTDQGTLSDAGKGTRTRVNGEELSRKCAEHSGNEQVKEVESNSQKSAPRLNGARRTYFKSVERYDPRRIGRERGRYDSLHHRVGRGEKIISH